MSYGSTIGTLASMALALLPLKGNAADAGGAQGMYLPGLTITAHTKGQDNPGPNAQHSVMRCDVLLWVSDDGIVRVAQIIKSTGHSRMDDACIRTIIGKPLTPAQSESGPVGSWAILPITWDFLSDPSKMKAADRPDSAVAMIASNQVPPVSHADYPKSALQRAEHGIVLMHAAVSESGAITDLQVVQSSGSADLDKAAIETFRSLRISPAFSDGKPVPSETDVAVAWVIPGADTMPPPALQK